MHVFLTGASGGMGSVLIPKLVSAGYSVTGLVRSDGSSAKVTALGATPVKGDLTDLDVIKQAASEADIVIHMGFDHGQAFTGDFVGACKKDKAVINAIGEGLTSSGSGGNKSFFFASGTLGLAGNDEHSEPHRSPHMPRYESTDAAFSYASNGVHVVQLRLAPITYGNGRPHDFIGMWAAESSKAGYVPYTDNGAWSGCSYDSAADGILLAVKKGTSLPNPISLHLLSENGVPFKDVAEALSKKLGVPAKRIEASDLQQLGFLGNLMGLAKPVSSDYTHQAIRWSPSDSGLVAQVGKWNFA